MTERRRARIWFFLGILAVLVMGIPYVILEQDAIFVYHDQLDGEVIAYLLKARHLWDGRGILPEFMNGAAKTALTLPAPACVLLYRWLPAWAALACMQVVGSLTGYVGMFLLIRYVARSEERLSYRQKVTAFVAMAVGCLYAYLPFLPVYGLSQYGLPLLLYCVLRLGEADGNTKTYIAAYLYVIFFGVNSSLVLAGFAVLGIWALWEVITLLRRRFRAGQGIGWLLLLTVYLLENGALLREIIGGVGAVSHKTEYSLASVSFWGQLWTNLLQGGQHSVDHHRWILVLAVCFVIVTGIRLGISAGDKKTVTGLEKALFLSCGGILLFAFAAAVWDSSIGVGIRSGLGALKGFQANRVLWLSPCLWYFALGCCLLMVVEYLPDKQETVKSVRKFLAAGGMLLAVGVTLLTAAQVLSESNLKPNVQKMLRADYSAMSLRDYYAVGVLEQVQQYIRDNFAEEPEDYRVVSLGIDPAAALYHGFYCLDGYSNNYDLAYKHRFREIIAPELDKSEYLTEQFDGWGNRCYLYSAECPGYYTVQKGGFYFQNYEINAQSLKELGGRYLLSAAYIDHCEDTGLKLIRENPFETEDSYYRIYLYRVME